MRPKKVLLQQTMNKAQAAYGASIKADVQAIAHLRATRTAWTSAHERDADDKRFQGRAMDAD
jgi:hypothetical protein